MDQLNELFHNNDKLAYEKACKFHYVPISSGKVISTCAGINNIFKIAVLLLRSGGETWDEHSGAGARTKASFQQNDDVYSIYTVVGLTTGSYPF